jgi:hypothetical protein
MGKGRNRNWAEWERVNWKLGKMGKGQNRNWAEWERAKEKGEIEIGWNGKGQTGKGRTGNWARWHLLLF